MGQDTDGGYGQARGAIQQGMGQQIGIEQRGEQAYQPYLGAGQYAIPKYEQALGAYADPNALYQQMMSQYRESPELGAQIQAGEQAAGRASSASGMLGSGAEMQHAAERAQSLRGQDIQNYLNRMMGMRQQYLGGLGGLAGMGERAAGGVGQLTGQLGQEIGQGYGGIARADIGEAQQPGIGGQLLGVAGTLGGALLGGPGGAAIGGALGGGLGKLFGGGQSQSQYGLPLPFQS